MFAAWMFYEPTKEINLIVTANVLSVVTPKSIYYHIVVG